MRVPWSDTVSVALCAAFVTGWTWTASGTHSLGLLAVALALVTAFYAAGSAAMSWGRLGGSFPLRLLLGYALVNTALFALAWISPLSIVANFNLLLVAAALAFVASRPRIEAGDPLPALACVVISLAAATFWAQDCLRPTEAAGASTVFKPWFDAFYHSAHIRLFSEAHGAPSIEDFRMPGVPARFYHYAPYLTPALVKALAPVPSYAAFGGILEPMGVLLTGLAAYALAASWWGEWPGLFAAAALLLLPDGSQQGVHNTFLGYHWMQMVGPAGMYAVALLALAWLLVCRGCAEGLPAQIAAGWALAGAGVVYKAQFFVANAFLLFVAAPLFLRGLSVRRRIAWAALSLAIFAAIARLAGRLPGVPSLRLDGSSRLEFLSMLRALSDPGPLKDLFGAWLERGPSGAAQLGLGSLYLVLAILGAFALAYPLLAIRRRRDEAPLVLLFPALAIASFLVMALNLAMDTRGIGTREELLHRPFVWIYFATAAWVGGSIGRLLPRRPAMALVLLPFLAVPALLGRGVQRMSTLPLADKPEPTALIEAASYVRAHSAPGDVLQDSRFDPTFLVTALSERRAFVILPMITVQYRLDEALRRAAEVDAFRALPDAALITAAAARMRLRWFIRHPEDAVSWPGSIQPAFTSDGYRVYRFE